MSRVFPNEILIKNNIGGVELVLVAAQRAREISAEGTRRTRIDHNGNLRQVGNIGIDALKDFEIHPENIERSKLNLIDKLSNKKIIIIDEDIKT